MVFVSASRDDFTNKHTQGLGARPYAGLSLLRKVSFSGKFHTKESFILIQMVQTLHTSVNIMHIQNVQISLKIHSE